MSRHRRASVASLLVACVVTLAACGGKSPTGPTPVQTGGGAPNPDPGPAPAPAPTGSATIAGQVVSLGAAFAGVTVGVEGTSIAATADANGRFALSNVPSGDRQLSFTGNGAEARLAVSGVAERERIELTVAVTGRIAEVVAQERVNGSEAQLEGRIVATDEAARTLVVGSTTVRVPAGVPIRHGATTLTFANLHVDDRVHVKGSRDGSVLTANEVTVQQGQDTPGGGNDTDETVRGAITGVSGACPGKQLAVAGKTVLLSDRTQYLRGASCGALTTGVVIEAEGPATGSTIAARRIFIEDGPGNGHGGNGVDQRVTGTISGLAGACPTRTFSVAGRGIVVNAATRYLGGASCAALANGATVEVEGPASGATITAEQVEIEDGPAGDTVRRGVVSNRGGSCPAISFTVQGTTVTTTAATVFRKLTCADVENGTIVEAEGTLTGNTLAAKKVQRED